MINVTNVEVRKMAGNIGKLDSIFSKLFEKDIAKKEDKEVEKEKEEEIIISFESEKVDAEYTNSSSSVSGEISELYTKLEEADTQSLKDAIKSAIYQKKEEYKTEELKEKIESYIEDSGLPKSQQKELDDIYIKLANADGVLQRDIIQAKIDELSEELNLSEEETNKLESFDAET